MLYYKQQTVIFAVTIYFSNLLSNLPERKRYDADT